MQQIIYHPLHQTNNTFLNNLFEKLEGTSNHLKIGHLELNFLLYLIQFIRHF